MRTIGKVMLGLAIAAFFGVAAMPAPAAPVWERCSEGTEKEASTKYSSNQCTKAESSGKWQWNEITGTEKIKGTVLTLTLKDLTAGPLKEKSTVRCSKGGEEEGTVGPSYDQVLIEKAVVKEASKNCARVEGPCKAGEVEEVKGVNLPWWEEPFETEKKFLTKIETSGEGEPGWAVKCATALGSKTDTCTSEGESKFEEELLENTVSSSILFVRATFKKAHKADCTEGGKESGEMEGAVKMEGSTGLRVEAEAKNSAIVITPNRTHDFGEVKIEEARRTTFTYKNEGTRDWRPNLMPYERRPLLNGMGGLAQMNTCNGKVVKEKETCTATIEFEPKNKGKYDGGLRDSVAPTITVEGRGIP